MGRTAFYPFIEGLRGFSFLWVLMYHIHYHFSFPINSSLDMFMRTGELGVSLFFLISGFLITGILIKDFDTPIDVRVFYVRRALKIIPSYVFLLLVTMAIFYKSALWQHVAGYLLFLQNYLRIVPVWGHLWLISVEEHFYCLFPLLLWGIFRIWPLAKQRHVALVVTLLVVWGLLVGLRHLGAFNVVWFPGQAAWQQMTHFRMSAIILGVMIKLFEGQIMRYGKKVTAWAGIAMAVLMVYYFSAFFWDFNMDIFLWGELSMAAVFLLSYGNAARSHELLGSKTLRFVGKNSYGLYLWHYPLVIFFQPFWKTYGKLPTISAYIVTVFACGILSTMIVEQYFLKVRDRWVPARI